MRIIRNIGILFVVASLIIATGGFSVYHHICHCAGEVSASVFVKASCDHEGSSTICCNADKSRSCCTGKPETKLKHNRHDGKCCNTSSQFLKINDSFQPELHKLSLKPFVVKTIVLLFDLQEDILLTPNLTIYSSDLPPPETGKQILTAHHQLKLDTHLV